MDDDAHDASGIRFTDEFKRDAVAQVVDRGYSIAEVSERLGISTKSLYTWKAQLSQPRKQINETTCLTTLAIGCDCGGGFFC